MKLRPDRLRHGLNTSVRSLMKSAADHDRRAAKPLWCRLPAARLPSTGLSPPSRGLLCILDGDLRTRPLAARFTGPNWSTVWHSHVANYTRQLTRTTAEMSRSAIGAPSSVKVRYNGSMHICFRNRLFMSRCSTEKATHGLLAFTLQLLWLHTMASVASPLSHIFSICEESKSTMVCSLSQSHEKGLLHVLDAHSQLQGG